MMESMTGFGEGSEDGTKLSITVSARSVNHRYLDLSVRMPEFLRRHERTLADLVRSRIGRGRVELRVDTSPLGEEERRVILRRGVLRAYRDAVLDARAEGLLSGDLTTGEILRLPEVIDVQSEVALGNDGDLEALQRATEDALERLKEARKEEGARLEGSLRTILDKLDGEVGALDAVRDDLRMELESRVRERIEQMAGDIEVDGDRLAMEVAILAERSDVQEELDRLSSHLKAFSDLLDSNDPVGKKLDFLCQEILRELNTVGSKCRDSTAMTHVLEGKVVCEQLREQVQNLQ
jgi:uncharacterized protein (TIGR00255 family)